MHQEGELDQELSDHRERAHALEAAEIARISRRRLSYDEGRIYFSRFSIGAALCLFAGWLFAEDVHRWFQLSRFSHDFQQVFAAVSALATLGTTRRCFGLWPGIVGWVLTLLALFALSLFAPLPSFMGPLLTLGLLVPILALRLQARAQLLALIAHAALTYTLLMAPSSDPEALAQGATLGGALFAFLALALPTPLFALRQ